MARNKSSYPSESNNWKEYEKNNITIALNDLHAEKEKHLSWLRFKTYSKCEKQGIILMTPKGEQWHYLGGKKIICIIMRNIVKT